MIDGRLPGLLDSVGKRLVSRDGRIGVTAGLGRYWDWRARAEREGSHMRIPWSGRGSPPARGRRWRLLLVPAMGLAVICQLSVTGSAGAATTATMGTARTAATGAVAPNPVNALDCNGYSPK